MSLALAAAALFVLGGDDQVMMRKLDLPSVDGGPSRSSLLSREARMSEPKISPRHGWQFDWIVAGYTVRPNGEFLRLRVFSQQRKSEGDPAPEVARMIMRLHEFNDTRLGLDHSEEFNNRIVDTYLCFGGKAGGEQLFDVDEQGGIRRKVNTIYIYDLSSFSDRLEMAREVAHEYGHAALPPFGVFDDREDWANGELGERLYLQWLRDGMKSGRMSSADAMGARAEAIDGYLSRYVVPLRAHAARNGPERGVIARRDRLALERFLGVVLHLDATMPRRVLARTLLLTDTRAPESIVRAAVEAAAELDEIVVATPSANPLWLPLGKGRVSGGAIVARRDGWAQIKPTSKSLKIENPPISADASNGSANRLAARR
jgi:hypothetical protein